MTVNSGARINIALGLGLGKHGARKKYPSDLGLRRDNFQGKQRREGLWLVTRTAAALLFS